MVYYRLIVNHILVYILKLLQIESSISNFLYLFDGPNELLNFVEFDIWSF
jgi:hypothetical protein